MSVRIINYSLARQFLVRAIYDKHFLSDDRIARYLYSHLESGPIQLRNGYLRGSWLYNAIEKMTCVASLHFNKSMLELNT